MLGGGLVPVVWGKGHGGTGKVEEAGREVPSVSSGPGREER